MRRFKITDVFIGILFTLLFISVSVVFTINFRPLYYMDIQLLHIESDSGLSKSEIIKNYDTLIDYSSPFYQGSLKFPTLPSSENGLTHFSDVKKLFRFFYLLGAITLTAGIIIMVYKSRKKDYSFLLTTSVISVVLPIICGTIFCLDFDRAFIYFHKIAFSNDDWLFDPLTDPVINILPDSYFMHCAMLIVIMILAFSAAFFTVYTVKKKYFSIKYRKNLGLKL